MAALGKSTVFFVGYIVLYGPGQEHVDMAAHLGGLVAGFACGLILRTPSDSTVPASRGRRNMIVGITGALAVGAGITLAGNNYADIQEELLRFGKTEEKVLASFNDLIRRGQYDSISDDTYASILRRDVIAPWESARWEFENVKNLPKKHIELHGQFVKYMNLRQEGWQLLLEAIEGDDEGTARRATAKQEEAQAVLEKI